jgi:hypothetical protein
MRVLQPSPTRTRTEILHLVFRAPGLRCACGTRSEINAELVESADASRDEHGDSSTRERDTPRPASRACRETLSSVLFEKNSALIPVVRKPDSRQEKIRSRRARSPVPVGPTCLRGRSRRASESWADGLTPGPDRHFSPPVPCWVHRANRYRWVRSLFGRLRVLRWADRTSTMLDLPDDSVDCAPLLLVSDSDERRELEISARSQRAEIPPWSGASSAGYALLAGPVARARCSPPADGGSG